MKNETENILAVGDFLRAFSLSIGSNGAIVSFPAKIMIKTSLNKFECKADVIITWGGYNVGDISIINSEPEIDVNLYPTIFIPRFKTTFEFVEKKILKLSGTHPSSAIGIYTVQIIPENKKSK